MGIKISKTGIALSILVAFILFIIVSLYIASERRMNKIKEDITKELIERETWLRKQEQQRKIERERKAEELQRLNMQKKIQADINLRIEQENSKRNPENSYKKEVAKEAPRKNLDQAIAETLVSGVQEIMGIEKMQEQIRQNNAKHNENTQRLMKEISERGELCRFWTKNEKIHARGQEFKEASCKY